MKRLNIVIVLIAALFLFSCENTDTGIIVNNTSASSTLYAVYITKTTNNYWGQNLLGSASIPPGGSEVFYLDGVYHDLRLEDALKYYEFYGISITDGQFVTVTYDGNMASYNASQSTARSLLSENELESDQRAKAVSGDL